MRKTVLGVLAAVATVVLLAGQAEATPKEPFVGYVAAVVGMTNADPWLVDDGCIGGATPAEPLYMIPGGPTSACSTVVGAPIVISPAGYFCWESASQTARKECTRGWRDQETRLLWAQAELDGRTVKVQHHQVSTSVTFADSFFGEPDGSTSAVVGILQGAVLPALSAGEHTVRLAFEYADGFAGDTTFTLTVTP